MRTLILALGGAMALAGCMVINVTGHDGGSGVHVSHFDSDATYAAALADPRRPADEVARDAAREPVAMMDLVGIDRKSVV